jgi:hypothetical protein
VKRKRRKWGNCAREKTQKRRERKLKRVSDESDLFRLLVCWYESRREVMNQSIIDTSYWEGGFFNHALRKSEREICDDSLFHFWV